MDQREFVSAFSRERKSFSSFSRALLTVCPDSDRLAWRSCTEFLGGLNKGLYLFGWCFKPEVAAWSNHVGTFVYNSSDCLSNRFDCSLMYSRVGINIATYRITWL